MSSVFFLYIHCPNVHVISFNLTMISDAGVVNGIQQYSCSTPFAETLNFLKHFCTEKKKNQ